MLGQYKHLMWCQLGGQDAPVSKSIHPMSILAPAIGLRGPTHLAAVFQVSARTVHHRALEYGLVEPGA
jgi:hypothetical protein